MKLNRTLLRKWEGLLVGGSAAVSLVLPLRAEDLEPELLPEEEIEEDLLNPAEHVGAFGAVISNADEQAVEALVHPAETAREEAEDAEEETTEEAAEPAEGEIATVAADVMPTIDTEDSMVQCSAALAKTATAGAVVGHVGDRVDGSSAQPLESEDPSSDGSLIAPSDTISYTTGAAAASATGAVAPAETDSLRLTQTAAQTSSASQSLTQASVGVSSGGTSSGAASGSAAGGGGGSAGGSGSRARTAPPVFLTGAAGATPPAGNMVWDGSVSNLKDGAAVTFRSTDAKGNKMTNGKLDVYLTDVYRPWSITVDDTNLTSYQRKRANNVFSYDSTAAAGYIIGGPGAISDYSADHATSITKQGGGTLILTGNKNNFSGGIDVQKGVLYIGDQGAAGTGSITLHDKAELWVNYVWNDDYSSSFRNPALSNAIQLTDNASTKISYGDFVYNVALNASGKNTTRTWRNLYLTGGLTGNAGTSLVLQGFTSRINLTPISSGTIPRQQNHLVGSTALPKQIWYSGFVLNRQSQQQSGGDSFEGTIRLSNRVVTSSNKDNYLNARESGAVKLVLSDDVLKDATLDLTREFYWIRNNVLANEKPLNAPLPYRNYNALLLYGTTDGSTAIKEDGSNRAQNYTPLSADSAVARAAAGVDVATSFLHQTYANILIANGNSAVGELKADFLGVTQDSYYDAVDWSEATELKYVRVITTEKDAHLTLGKETATSDSWYAGTMGLAGQMYGAREGYDNVAGKDVESLTDENATVVSVPSQLSEAGLSLIKKGDNRQFIHTATLRNLTVEGGVVGFNSLELLRNLTLKSGTTLSLGVQGEGGVQHWTSAGSTEVKLGYAENAQRLRVDAVTGQDGHPVGAVLQGSLTLGSKAELNFNFDHCAPVSLSTSYLKEHDVPDTMRQSCLLDVTSSGPASLSGEAGKFSINAGTAVTLSGINFLDVGYKDKTFFLAAADELVHADTFGSRIIKLDYGFYGILEAINGTDVDYLVMTVVSDPTRSWTGSGQALGTKDNEEDTSDWLSSAREWRVPGKDIYYNRGGVVELQDSQWKEDRTYVDGVSVKFGNLYEPTVWDTRETETTPLFADVVSKVNGRKPFAAEQGNGKAVSLFGMDLGADNSAYNPENPQGHYEEVRIVGTVRPGYVTVNSDYELLQEDGSYVAVSDDTNYIFSDGGDGCIADASAEAMMAIYGTGSDFGGEVSEEDLRNWKTALVKGGTGTLIIETANTYSGGSKLEGGLTVMRNRQALGLADRDHVEGHGGAVEMSNGAGLMADYVTKEAQPAQVSGGKVVKDGVIAQSLLDNELTVTHRAEYDNTYVGDAVLYNRYDTECIVETLTSYSDAVLTLRGASLSSGKMTMSRDFTVAGKTNTYTLNLYTYAAFSVENPKDAYGTIRMSGYHWGEDGRLLSRDAEGNVTGFAESGGNVQLTIGAHSAADANTYWNHTTIDMTPTDETSQHVLALETRYKDGKEHDGREMLHVTLANLKSDAAQPNQVCVINDASSERLASNKYGYLVNLILGPREDAVFKGNIGYGIGQNMEGVAMPSRGYISLTKTGSAAQTISNAKLKDVVVGVNSTKETGGLLHVEGALSACTLSTTVGGSDFIHVGAVDDSVASHTLVVGKDGILAFETTSHFAADPLANLRSVETDVVYGSGTSHVLLEDGATITAAGNWQTAKIFAVQHGAAVNFNTHEYRMDPTISSNMEVYGQVAQDLKDAFNTSHIIQLDKGLTGENITLNLSNEQMSAGATEDERGKATYNGYVIMRDLNRYLLEGQNYGGLKGESKVNIGEKTVLQIKTDAGDNSHIRYDISGEKAALQFYDSGASGVASYVHEATLTEGGSVLFGGRLATETDRSGNATQKEEVDITKEADVVIDQRYAAESGEVGNLKHTTVNTARNGVTYETILEGADGGCAALSKTRMTMKEESSVNKTLLKTTDITGSLLSLQNKCSLSMEDVLVKVDSMVQGAGAENGNKGAMALSLGATAASNQAPNVSTPSFSSGSLLLTDDATKLQVSVTKTADGVCTVGNGGIYVAAVNQLARTDVGGTGMTLQMQVDDLKAGVTALAEYGEHKFIALRVENSGRFLYESMGSLDAVKLTTYAGATITGADVDPSLEPSFVVRVVSSEYVAKVLGVAPSAVSNTLLYIEVPEPSASLFSLFALAAAAFRRRRK